MATRLSERHVDLQRRVRDFVREEVLPTAPLLEAIADPSQRFPWSLIEKASAVGLRNLSLDRELGGEGVDCLGEALATEELAKGDVGVSQILHTHWIWCELFNRVASDHHRKQFLPALNSEPTYLLAGALTESATGSDNMLPYDDIEAGPHLLATRDGSDFVLNGHKALIANGGVARLYCIQARTDPRARPSEGSTWFFVPADTPGFSIGSSAHKMGQRLAPNTELIFEDCRVAAENIIGQEGRGPASANFSVRNPTILAAQAVGCAQSSLDTAIDWAQRRVQGGRPIIEHQAVALMLADMAILVDAARSLVWRSCDAIDSDPDDDGTLGMKAKVFATEVAPQVALQAIQVLGGYGTLDDRPVAKQLRDAASMFQSGGGPNPITKLKIARHLAPGDTVWRGDLPDTTLRVAVSPR